MNHFLTIVLIGSLVFFSGCMGPPVNNVADMNQDHSSDDSIVVVIPPNDTNTPVQPDQNEVEVVPQPDEIDVSPFDPELTYTGKAYNGPLYATSEQIENNPKKEQLVTGFKRNGVNFVIGFFPVLGKATSDTFVSGAHLGYVADLVSQYPGRIVPFFNSGLSADGLKGIVSSDTNTWITVHTDVVDSQSAFVGSSFFRGFGDIEAHAWTIPYTNPAMTSIASLAEEKNMDIFIHPAEGKLNQLGMLAQQFPNRTFVIHLNRIDVQEEHEKIIDLLKTHENVYFSIGASQLLQYNGKSVMHEYEDDETSSAEVQFIAFMGQKYKPMLISAVNDYKPIVEAVPDKVMWGTEVNLPFAFEPQAYDLILKFSRDFIGSVSDDAVTQKALAYENAFHVFGYGATWDGTPVPIDSSNWLTCTKYVMDAVCDDCGDLPNAHAATKQQIAAQICMNTCVTKQQCIEKKD